MPRAPVHTVADAPAESQETLEALGKQVGKVINILAEMAHAPALLKMYATTEQLLREKSSLDEATRQAIHLAVAHTNACEYRQAAYTGSAKAAGHSEGATEDFRRGALPDDEKLTALLAVAREIAANTGYAEVSCTIMTNYFNHLVGTDLDLPAAPDLN